MVLGGPMVVTNFHVRHRAVRVPSWILISISYCIVFGHWLPESHYLNTNSCQMRNVSYTKSAQLFELGTIIIRQV